MGRAHAPRAGPARRLSATAPHRMGPRRVPAPSRCHVHLPDLSLRAQHRQQRVLGPQHHRPTRRRLRADRVVGQGADPGRRGRHRALHVRHHRVDDARVAMVGPDARRQPAVVARGSTPPPHGRRRDRARRGRLRRHDGLGHSVGSAALEQRARRQLLPAIPLRLRADASTPLPPAIATTSCGPRTHGMWRRRGGRTSC